MMSFLFNNKDGSIFLSDDAKIYYKIKIKINFTLNIFTILELQLQ
jgi:hypothetical protein